ncbi:Protein archease [bacterium HR36]|uniref:Hypothetical conserved protein n=1 Tax=uncultured Planctomycetota bacterium TaxID=120965 RepID=H5S893_9BACT|nr:hypothetical conserved protein [uncultured Planctomycetota bacterium]GBD36920.1 Protein archease [bacterium HR36]
MFEVFAHTADLGLRIRAGDLPTLFAEAGKALFSVLVENLEAIACRETHPLTLENDNLEYLFFDWLDQLLYLFDAQKLVLADFQVTITGGEMANHVQGGRPAEGSSDAGKANAPCWRLEAICRGEKLDRQRHILDHEVKAITYHGLKVEKAEGGWLAEVVVDI